MSKRACGAELHAISRTNEANEVLTVSVRTALVLEKDDAPDGAEEQAVTIGCRPPSSHHFHVQMLLQLVSLIYRISALVNMNC